MSTSQVIFAATAVIAAAAWIAFAEHPTARNLRIAQPVISRIVRQPMSHRDAKAGSQNNQSRKDPEMLSNLWAYF